MIKLIIYHHPLFIKHVLAPQNEFGIQKNTWSIYKSFGNWGDPPHVGRKFPNNPVIFFLNAYLMTIVLYLWVQIKDISPQFYINPFFGQQNGNRYKNWYSETGRKPGCDTCQVSTEECSIRFL